MPILRNRTVQRLAGGYLERFLIRNWGRLMMTGMSVRKDPEALRVVRQVFYEKRGLLTSDEFFMLASLVRSQCKSPGAFAEVGVFRGASAKLICELKGDRPLHLFDTFVGLPASTEPDNDVHRIGQYASDLESVRDYLRDYPGLHWYPGLFPDSAIDVPDELFCFAHFDVDLYASTKACLEYFYPRMTPGGVMVTHDYDILAGVRQAFQEFFRDKPETPIELSTTQCMAIKLGRG